MRNLTLNTLMLLGLLLPASQGNAQTSDYSFEVSANQSSIRFGNTPVLSALMIIEDGSEAKVRCTPAVANLIYSTSKSVNQSFVDESPVGVFEKIASILDISVQQKKGNVFLFSVGDAEIEMSNTFSLKAIQTERALNTRFQIDYQSTPVSVLLGRIKMATGMKVNVDSPWEALGNQTSFFGLDNWELQHRDLERGIQASNFHWDQQWNQLSSEINFMAKPGRELSRIERPYLFCDQIELRRPETISIRSNSMSVREILKESVGKRLTNLRLIWRAFR